MSGPEISFSVEERTSVRARFLASKLVVGQVSAATIAEKSWQLTPIVCSRTAGRSGNFDHVAISLRARAIWSPTLDHASSGTDAEAVRGAPGLAGSAGFDPNWRIVSAALRVVSVLFQRPT